MPAQPARISMMVGYLPLLTVAESFCHQKRHERKNKTGFFSLEIGSIYVFIFYFDEC